MKTKCYNTVTAAPPAGGKQLLQCLGGHSPSSSPSSGLMFFFHSVSGVIGQAEQFDGPRLAVVVVLALLVIAGVRQQRPLWVPGDGEGRRVALNLPELLSCTHKHQP